MNARKLKNFVGSTDFFRIKLRLWILCAALKTESLSTFVSFSDLPPCTEEDDDSFDIYDLGSRTQKIPGVNCQEPPPCLTDYEDYGLLGFWVSSVYKNQAK